jgi:hypothetical protein
VLRWRLLFCVVVAAVAIIIIITSILVVISVPSLPFDDPDPGHSKMRLHAQQCLVVPIGGPFGDLGGFVPMYDNRQKGADHHQSIRRIKLNGLGSASAS